MTELTPRIPGQGSNSNRLGQKLSECNLQLQFLCIKLLRKLGDSHKHSERLPTVSCTLGGIRVITPLIVPCLERVSKLGPVSLESIAWGSILGMSTGYIWSSLYCPSSNNSISARPDILFSFFHRRLLTRISAANACPAEAIGNSHERQPRLGVREGKAK